MTDKVRWGDSGVTPLQLVDLIQKAADTVELGELTPAAQKIGADLVSFAMVVSPAGAVEGVDRRWLTFLFWKVGEVEYGAAHLCDVDKPAGERRQLLAQFVGDDDGCGQWAETVWDEHPALRAVMGTSQIEEDTIDVSALHSRSRLKRFLRDKNIPSITPNHNKGDDHEQPTG